MSAPDLDAIEASYVSPIAGLSSMLDAFAPGMGDMLTGLIPDIDPDAVTLDDLALRLDAIETQMVELVATLAPVVELAHAVKANADKLARFGLKYPR